MQHPLIAVPEGYPGISAAMAQYPDTGAALGHVAASVLEKDTEEFPRHYREYLGAFVSWMNGCDFCYYSHLAVAHALGMSGDVGMAAGFFDNMHSPIWRVLRAIALRVIDLEKIPGYLSDEIKLQGISDETVHDAVLIASAFCMFNRYVMTLNLPEPYDLSEYRKMGKQLAEHGYRRGK